VHLTLNMATETKIPEKYFISEYECDCGELYFSSEEVVTRSDSDDYYTMYDKDIEKIIGKTYGIMSGFTIIGKCGFGLKKKIIEEEKEKWIELDDIEKLYIANCKDFSSFEWYFEDIAIRKRIAYEEQIEYPDKDIEWDDIPFNKCKINKIYGKNIPPGEIIIENIENNGAKNIYYNLDNKSIIFRDIETGEIQFELRKYCYVFIDDSKFKSKIVSEGTKIMVIEYIIKNDYN
jgi:hypothetical protein